MNQRTDWTVRNLLELQHCAWSLYVTLTYDDEHAPANVDGVLEVEKYDVQTWLKRFRKWLDKHYSTKVRYFLTSEYGEGLRRPHYHLLLYFPTLDSRKIATFDAIENTWGKGNVKFGDVEPASVHYCMKYLMKFDEEIEPLPSGINKPFRLMSRKPALGVPWLTDSRKQYYADKIAEDKPRLVQIEDRQLNLPRFLQGKCLKLPWDIIRSHEFHKRTYISDNLEERKAYGSYLNSVAVPMSFDEWQFQFPKWKRNQQLDAHYKEAYIKHLKEHLIL